MSEHRTVFVDKLVGNYDNIITQADFSHGGYPISTKIYQVRDLHSFTPTVQWNTTRLTSQV